jgi:outer membrane protein assembly factor BamD (BamD/ComL family)
MADIILTVPDAKAPEILDAFAAKYDYNRLKQTGETKIQFAKRMLAAHISDVYQWYMAKQAGDAAATTAGQVIIT